MKIRLLPSSCSEPDTLQPLTTFLVNETLAIDGGSLGCGLALEQQKRVRRVIITHAHSDHIATLPVFLAEVFPFLKEPVCVYSVLEVIRALQDHVFNDLVWPDFYSIDLLHGDGPGLRYVEIEPLVPFEVEGLRVTPVEMNHTVRTIGLAVEDDRSAVIVTSDTYHTEEIWRLANRLEHLKALFVDVSYPNEMQALAAASRHFTPRSLAEELRKLKHAAPVFAVHLKPQFQATVRQQLAQLDRSDVVVAEIDHDYCF
jgi:cAMP phosphodiesterase